MIIQCMFGLGDNLYFRPVLKWLPQRKDITLITPWPQVFCDFPHIKFMRPVTPLRTQSDNIKRDLNWEIASAPPDYILQWIPTWECSLTTSFFNQIYGEQPTWIENSMIVPDRWITDARLLIDNESKPLCLLRPNTLRSEAMYPARNPKYEYLQQFIDMYQDTFHIITIANLKDGEEWYERKLQGKYQELLNPTLEQTIGLFKLASVVITSPSFWMPLGIELNSNMLVIYGAALQHWNINDKRAKAPNCLFVEPEPFERCSVRKSNAYRDIDERVLVSKFKEVTSKWP